MTRRLAPRPIQGQRNVYAGGLRHDNSKIHSDTCADLVGTILASLLAPALADPADVEWTTYTGNWDGSRYKPLDQINASNFSKLEMVWRFKTDHIGNRPEFKLEGTPLEVGGVIYTTAGSRRGAIALDAVTGELLWVHGEREGARGARRRGNYRGADWLIGAMATMRAFCT